MTVWLAMMLAGGVGAVLRVLVTSSVDRRFGARMGTTAANLVGTLLLAGMVTSWNADASFIVGVGFLGGFTTFSTWMVSAIVHAAESDVRTALLEIGRVAAMAVVVAAIGLGVAGQL